MRFVNGVSVNLIHDNIQFNSIQQFTMNDKSIKFDIICRKRMKSRVMEIIIVLTINCL